MGYNSPLFNVKGYVRMPGLGTVINVAAIVVAGLLGAGGGKLLNERIQDGLAKAAGAGVLFFGMDCDILSYNRAGPEICGGVCADAVAIKAYPAAKPERSVNMVITAYQRSPFFSVSAVYYFF